MSPGEEEVGAVVVVVVVAWTPMLLVSWFSLSAACFAALLSGMGLVMSTSAKMSTVGVASDVDVSCYEYMYE